ncbi:MAG: hypothetical protein ACK4FJ_06385 [Ferrovibrio sp.]|uniref:hypothetical protein n=1 Tax=Ferrovibrio sp. TaxID=1917215 RepID=UPI003919D71B
MARALAIARPASYLMGGFFQFSAAAALQCLFVRSAMSRHNPKPVIEPVEPDWSTALVLICSECDGGRGVDLAGELKDAVKAAGHRKDVRVARVRCLGICPKHGIAVTVTAPGRPAQSFIVTGRDRDAVPALCAQALRKISG